MSVEKCKQYDMATTITNVTGPSNVLLKIVISRWVR